MSLKSNGPCPWGISGLSTRARLSEDCLLSREEKQRNKSITVVPSAWMWEARMVLGQQPGMNAL